MTRTAVPLVALLVLGAGPFEMALLIVAAQSLASCSSGSSPAPGSTAFARGRPDLGRRHPAPSCCSSIPAAYLAGVLRIEQLYLVVFLEGCLGALFDAAYPAYVPSLIGVDRVVEGNSKLAPARRWPRSAAPASPAASSS